MTLPGAETMKAGIIGLECLRMAGFGRRSSRCEFSISSVRESEEQTELAEPFACPLVVMFLRVPFAVVGATAIA